MFQIQTFEMQFHENYNLGRYHHNAGNGKIRVMLLLIQINGFIEFVVLFYAPLTTQLTLWLELSCLEMPVQMIAGVMA